jgi:phosphopantothenoylcysteine decarboxylase/phosphopantothenate--cysteine ligase
MRKRTLVVPAMDLDMYAHPTTKRNLKQIEQDACFVIPAKIGELASGLVGEGRMAEPEEIVSEILRLLQIDQPFLNKKVLITAGPTQEAIDPVRFIGNNSSGKMGFALAEQALNLGAEVHLITGPTSCILEHEKLFSYPVAAAVADYRPVSVAEQKIKKSEDTLQIDLIKNPDIVAWAATHKNNNQKVIGFALETNNAIENALGKITAKKMDAIVLNSLGEKGVGFEVDTNKITILDSKGNLKEFELKLKSQVAKDIFEFILKLEK